MSADSETAEAAEAVAEEDAEAGEAALKKREEEEAKRAEAELELLREYIEEVKRRYNWRSELRRANTSAADTRPEEADFHKLDSSLKKNTAFIRKLKNFSSGQADVIKREMLTLNLTKYVGEVAAALVAEAKLKMTDVPAAVELCCLLHQRYLDLSQHLLEVWEKALTFKKEDKAVLNPSKLRVDLRFYAELVSVGVFSLKEGLPLLGQALTFLVNSDKETHGHVALILAFCKYCGDDYAGLLPKRIREPADRHRYEVPESSLLAPDKRKGVRQLLKDYYVSLLNHTRSEHRELQSVERTNRRILLTKGEVHTERTDKAEALKVSAAKLMASLTQLADALDEDVPEMEEAEQEDDEIEAEKAAKEEASALGDIWDDEETKSFYEDLVDLKAFIPAILYKESAQGSDGGSGQKQKQEAGEGKDKADKLSGAEAAARAAEAELLGEDFEADLALSLEEAMAQDVKPPSLDDDADDADNQNASAKMLLAAFLDKLPTCVSREMIDNAAVDFCMNLNTKNNRKKLVKTLFSVHRNRQDLLPFYSRLAATLSPCMPEVPQSLSAYLKQEFRWQVRKKDQMKVESKLKVCHFIGEMVKFGHFAKAEALFCLKMLLFDFTHHNIEMACALMESSGRFLFRSEDSHQRTKIYLEQMMRKKSAMMSLDARYKMMIENAFYVVNPPEVAPTERVSLPPTQQYVHRLLYHDLGRNNTEKVLKQMRRLDWKDRDMAEFAARSLAAVWNYKYTNIRYSASLLAGLAPYHEWLGPRIVDAVLEDVRLMMEINEPKYNQRRISVIKYLAELYNYRLVDSAVVFKVLYSLISFGAANRVDDPEATAGIDPPDHMLRIRLVCVALDTCGMYFNTGGSRKKLDYFLIFFQRYVWRKRASLVWSNEPKSTIPEEEEEEEENASDDCKPKDTKKTEVSSRFPITVVNLVTETVAELRPKLRPYQSLEEAEESAARVEREMLKNLQEKAPGLAVYLQKESNEEGQIMAGGAKLGAIAEEEGSEEEAEDERLVDVEVADDEDDDNSQLEDLSQKEDFSQSQDSDFCDNENNEDEEDEDGPSWRADHLDQADSALQVGPKHVRCDEDDEFVEMFDKMLTENIAEYRGAHTVPRGQQVDIVAPMVAHRASKKTPFDPANSGEKEEGTVQFSVLVRKGNKHAYKDLAVPADSDLALNLQRQEEADRLEKERVKRLTLQINERQEEEDFVEALAQMQRPGLVPAAAIVPRGPPPEGRSRGSGRGHHHHQGVPDADAIFGRARNGR